jgi:feruloyl esterase
MVSGLLSQHGTLEKLMRATARNGSASVGSGSKPSHLVETKNFGSNPGALRMFRHVPSHASRGCALVVVLHGCAQTAAAYDLGAGWSTLADRFGFALLLPEQKRANNANGCFNWFEPADTRRGSGEALSIRQMIEKMVSTHGVDTGRIYITGLSAGGAMTSVLLATYPEVFAGGAIIAGLPFGAASNVQQAFQNMLQCPARPARTWGDLVRAASPHIGPWPRISVWHGGADSTVVPSNAQEIVKQWTDVHGLPVTPSLEAVVDGYPRQVWANEAGTEIIESYTIPQMMHGTPLATGYGHDECGAAGPFLLEVGISSSYHIAKFFGLRSHDTPLASDAIVTSDPHVEPRVRREGGSGVAPRVLEGEILGPEDQSAGPDESRTSRPLPIDVGAVINNALRAAGLVKG